MVRALLPAISATWVIGVPASSSLEINVSRAVYHVIFSSIPRISQTLSNVSLTRVEKFVTASHLLFVGHVFLSIDREDVVADPLASVFFQNYDETVDKQWLGQAGNLVRS